MNRERWISMRHTVFAGLLFGLVVTLSLPEIASAIFKQSHAHNTGKFRLRQDPKSGWYWTTDGDILLAAEAYAQENGGTDRDPDYNKNQKMPRWAGLKSGLPGAMPTLPENDVGQYTAWGCVQAYAVVGMTYGRGNARAAWTPPAFHWGTLNWATDAAARGNPAAKTSNSYANGWLDDPIRIGWEEAGTYELILEVTLDSSDTSMATDSDGSALFNVSSSLDIDDDGIFDQLFCSLNYGRNSESGRYVDFVLGPSVYLEDGMTESQIENTIDSMWTDSYNFLLIEDLVFAVRYTINSTGPGTLSFDLHSHVTAEAVPEPATVLLLGFGGLALLRRRRG